MWVLATVFLAQSQFDLVDWATYAVAFGGALVLALGIGWWRVIRHGPEARRGGSAACGALIMCVWLLVDAKDDDRALVWGVVFGLIGIVQYVRYLRYRDR